MSIDIGNIEILGLDSLKSRINKEFKVILIILSLFIFLPFLFIGDKETMLVSLFMYIFMSLILLIYFLIYRYMRLREFNYINTNSISTIRYTISNNHTTVYLNNRRSVLIEKLDFSNIDKPVLDFEKGILRLGIARWDIEFVSMVLQFIKRMSRI